MGKKHKKGRDSNLSVSSYSEQNSRDSSFNSFDASNTSINKESAVPEKFLVVSVESAKCAKYANILKSNWEDVVFLHPSIMKAYNIEDLVVIKGEEKTVLCTAYALESLRKNFIVFPKCNNSFQYQELVSLCNFEGEVKNAEKVLITYNEDIKETDGLQNQYISRLLYNKYLYAGLVVKWKLIDREYSYTIQEITSSLDICNLSLKSSSNHDTPTFYRATYKTSVTSKPYKKAPLRTEMEVLTKSSAFDQIGGTKKQIELICRYMEMFLTFDNGTGSVYCGTLLLTGPQGCGKSLLLQSITNNYNIYTENISWPLLCEGNISREREAFQRAKDRAPSIILLDDLSYSKSLPKLIETLDDAKVFVIATTSDPEFDASVLRTSNRILETVKIQAPSSDERIDILNKLLKSRDHNLSVEEIQKCANPAHGFTGRDLLEGIKDAQIEACKREFSDILENIVMKKGHAKGKINYHDLECSFKRRKPSIVTSELKVKKVHWSDIGGMTDVIEKLKQLVEWPLKFSEVFKQLNITPSHGVLMYGPPGCSKTMIAKALATECELNFISKNASDLYDKYVGESEKAVRYLFAEAKAKSPCIIFLDEIDALVGERGSSSGSSGVGDRIVTTLLTEMDGVEELQGVFIIAATNRPDKLDDALVRNGRIDQFIYVPLPDARTREEILKINMRNRLLSDNFDFKALVEKMEGYSGAEIVNLCNEAALQLFSEDPEAQSPTFKFCHFEKAMYIPPRTNKDMIKFYESFNEKHCTKDNT